MAIRKSRWNSSKKARRVFKNDEIKAFTIQVIDEEWENLWEMPRAKALNMAWEKWLDLVQISYDPKTKTCTAKIVDFGKYQYDQKKAENEKKKKQKKKWQKNIKFGYNIWDNDLDLKIKKAIEFLKGGYNVKVNVILKWREKVYRAIARTRLDVVEEQLAEVWRSQWVKQENFWFTLMIMSLAR